jgi:SAM-dependent methyltransferase
MWASVAASWGASADDIDQRVAPITERMLDAVAVHAGDRVLELASGPGGAGLAAASPAGPSGEVVISDVVPVMVDIARQRAVAQGFTNVRAEVLDLENIAEPDEAYDVVLCRDGMMFALDPARAAAEMHRVLRPAGRAAVAVWASRQDNPWLGVLLNTITRSLASTCPHRGPRPVRAVRCRRAPAGCSLAPGSPASPRLRRRAAAVAVVRRLVDPQPHLARPPAS